MQGQHMYKPSLFLHISSEQSDNKIKIVSLTITSKEIKQWKINLAKLMQDIDTEV